MFNDLPDLSKSIDALIDGLTGFFYRVVSTFATVIFSPKWGATRASALRERYLKAASALLVATAMIAVSSVLGPKTIPSLLAEKHHEVLEWVTYMLLLYIPFDLSILLCARILNRKHRYRERTVSILRYSVAAMLSLWFVVAISPKTLSPSTSARATHNAIVASLQYGYQGLRDATMLWSFILLVCGVFVVSWSSSKTIGARFYRLGITAAILGLCTYVVDKPSLPILYATAKLAFPEEERQQKAAPERSAHKVLAVGPLLCQVSKPDEMQVAAAVTNDSDSPVALDTSLVQMWFQKPDSTLIKPDFLKLPLDIAKMEIAVFPPRSVVVLNGTVHIKLTDLTQLGKSCVLEYSSDQTKEVSIFSMPGAVQAANSRGVR
jgi:hypothetical protein